VFLGRYGNAIHDAGVRDAVRVPRSPIGTGHTANHRSIAFMHAHQRSARNRVPASFFISVVRKCSAFPALRSVAAPPNVCEDAQPVMPLPEADSLLGS
jgi:hypothetical protein